MGVRWKHFKTVCKHKHVVFQECRACHLTWQGIVHDLSKFSPVEFSSSAKYFQGDKSPIEQEKALKGYSMAWQHHKGHNPHHWEYWTDFDANGQVTCCKVPYKYVVEMLCDWIGASKVYNASKWSLSAPYEYFLKVRGGRHFNPSTEALIVSFLLTIRDYGLETFHRMARCEGYFSELRYDYEHDQPFRELLHKVST